MTSLSEEERSLRAYLLGEAAPDEQRQIEERLLLDDAYVQDLLIAEEELVDSYVSDTLSEREREQFQKHFLTTPKRRSKLRKAKALRRYVDSAQPMPTPAPINGWWSRVWGGQPWLTPAWRSAIAAMLVLGLALGIWRGFIYQSLTDKGRAALQAALRESPTEARIAGFNWTPPQVTLGEHPNNIADETSLESAERYLLDAVNTQHSPDSHYALGQFYFAKGDLDSAIKQFNQALEGMPKNAKLHSDLGAALLEKAKAEDVLEQANPDQRKGADTSLDDRSQSLEHLNKALELNDSLLEALFNRALCHQHMKGLLPLAEADWREYLRRDANSPWADAARQHLEEVEHQKQKNSQSKEEQFNEFLSAYQTDDQATAWKVVSQTREWITGRLIWWQLLNDFFELLVAGQLAEANARIEALQYVGKLELHLGEEKGEPKGDAYISKIAEFYRSTSSQQRADLSEAHKRMNEGNQFYRDDKNAEALDRYRQARQSFTRIGDKEEAMLADFLIGSCLIPNGETKQNQSLLEQLVGECREKGYLWLLAQSSFSLGMVQDILAEHSKALESTRQALQISEEISDTYNTQRSLCQIADQYRKLGNYELSTAYLNRCLKQIDVAWPGNRQMWRNCDQLTQVLTAKQLNAAAAAYASEALRLALEMGPKYYSNIYVSYVHLALIRAEQQDYPEAIRLAQLGLAIAPNDVYKADASLQLGQVRSQAGDWNQALEDYNQSINYIESAKADPKQAEANNLPALSYYAHKGKLSCLNAQGNITLVQQEFTRTAELLEQYRANIREEQNRNTFFNVEQAVYDAAIDFQYSKRNDNQAAFEYSERSRARSLLDMVAAARARITAAQAQAVEADSNRRGILQRISQPLSLDQIQQQLPDQTQLIEYAVLDDKLLICLVSKSEFSVKEVQIRLSELTDKVLNFRRAILRHTTEPLAEAQELYNLLIDPIKLSPEKGKQICIVPDKILNNLPFGALVSPGSGSYFIEDYQLTVAPSATIYLVCSEQTGHTTDRDHERLLAVGDPTFDRTEFSRLPPLLSTQQQVRKIAESYPSPLPLVLIGANAREEVVKRAMEECDVIQLASHYVVSAGNPMNSKLLLAKEPADPRKPDSSAGFLQAEEVYGLNLRHAPLVVLAACQSGVEYYYRGEGMIGMSRVFLAAGAPVVVASLWPVDVYATNELMINFHQHRKLERSSASEALRLAQVDMLKNPSKRHPYYWAGFTTIGGHPGF